jgi:hypothetical protein
LHGPQPIGPAGTRLRLSAFLPETQPCEAVMRRIIKALILGWIGKKIYDRVTDHGGEGETTRSKQRSAAHRKPSPRRTARKTTRRAA